MAIIIPSKRIYEINNQKVVDNEVDNIEVEAKNPEIIQDFNTNVYNESVNVDDIQLVSSYQTIKEDNIRGGAGEPYTYIRLATTSQLRIGYKTIQEVKVKKLQNNKLISKIHYQKDKNDDFQIKYNLTADLKTYEDCSIGYNPNKNYFEFYNPEDSQGVLIVSQRATSYKDIDYSQEKTINADYPRIKTDLSCKIDNGTINSRSYIVGTDTRWTSSPPYSNMSESTSNLQVEEVLAFDKIEETDDYYILKNLKICVSVENKLGFAWLESETPFSEWSEEGVTGNPDTIQGTIITLTPLSVEFTIYGDTISLDLQDETVKIGDGQHVYSFSGNELMQTSNTPTIENTYNKIIRSWQNGKEIAVLKCGIDKYIDNFGTSESVEINISEKLQSATIENETGIIFTSSEMIDLDRISGINLIVESNLYHIKDIISLSGNNRYEAVVEAKYSEISKGTNNLQVNYIGRIAINPYDNNYPMTFHIGDTVILYIRGGDGNDKPMSYYSDKTTPKEFIVIGKGIIADGELMQEITTQEITK